MDENYKGIGERIIDNGYFMRDERLAGPDDGNLDIGNIIDMFSKGISLDEKVVPRDKDLTSVEEIFQEDTPLTEGIFGLSEGFTLSPITILRRYLANKELKKEKEFADGGMTGDKTYHQVRDQFMPMDSESMGYAYGGGIGSMMQPRMNFAGGGGDFIGLNPNGPITIEDLTETDNNGNFLISAAEALPNQTGTINSAPSITNRDLRTIEGSLIDGDDPSSRYAVQQDFPTSQSLPSSAAIAAALGSIGSNQLEGYQDMIMNPEGFPNALQNLERYQDNRFSDLDFQPGYDFIDAPNKTNTLLDLYQNRNYIDNPRTGFFDKNIMSKGNPDASLMNKTKNSIGSGITGVMDLMGRLPTPMNAIKGFANMRNPLSPNSQNYNPALQGQVDFLKDKNAYGIMDQSGLNKITSGRLAGKNLVSGFGTNDLTDMYAKDLEKLEGYLETMPDRFSRLKKNSPKEYLAKQQRLEAKIAQSRNEAAQVAAAAEKTRLADVARIRASAPAFNPNTTSGGRGSYRSDRDNSRDGGYGGSSKRSADNRSSDLGFSDIRLKDNIELVGKSPSDINIYNFTYLNDSTVYQGVMAQEVPWASVKHDSGYLMVDYNKVDVDFKRQ